MARRDPARPKRDRDFIRVLLWPRGKRALYTGILFNALKREATLLISFPDIAYCVSRSIATGISTARNREELPDTGYVTRPCKRGTGARSRTLLPQYVHTRFVGVFASGGIVNFACTAWHCALQVSGMQIVLQLGFESVDSITLGYIDEMTSAVALHSSLIVGKRQTFGSVLCRFFFLSLFGPKTSKFNCRLFA